MFLGGVGFNFFGKRFDVFRGMGFKYLGQRFDVFRGMGLNPQCDNKNNGSYRYRSFCYGSDREVF